MFYKWKKKRGAGSDHLNTHEWKGNSLPQNKRPRASISQSTITERNGVPSSALCAHGSQHYPRQPQHRGFKQRMTEVIEGTWLLVIPALPAVSRTPPSYRVLSTSELEKELTRLVHLGPRYLKDKKPVVVTTCEQREEMATLSPWFSRPVTLCLCLGTLSESRYADTGPNFCAHRWRS